ncbi:MAG: ABC transporter substrate-binding protein [Massiliimalia sp.]|jgi:sn-glycerol 3-phosphate transport system substrate-binding protein
MKHSLKCLLCCALCALALFPGCSSATTTSETSGNSSSNSSSEKQIVFWSTKEDVFAEETAQFTEETGIQVEATYMGGYDDMVNKVMAGIAADSLPDVAQLGQRHGVSQMYDSGKLLAVEDKLPQELLDDILPGFWKRFTYKDKKVIIPFQNSMPVLYYNADLFEQAGITEIPSTFDQVVSTAKTITDKTGIYGFTTAEDSPWYVNALIYNAGSDMVSEDNQAVGNNEQVRSIFEAYQQMATVDMSMAPNQHATAKEDFANGRVAMFMTSCASYADLTNLINGQFELKVAQFPEITTMDIPMGGNGLGLFASTPEREEWAVEFVEFMLEPERVAQSTLDTGYIPVTNAAIETDTYKEYLKDPNRQIIHDQLQYLGGRPVNPADSLVWSEILGLIDTVEADPDADISEKLEEIDTKVQKYLDDYEAQ